MTLSMPVACYDQYEIELDRSGSSMINVKHSTSDFDPTVDGVYAAVIEFTEPAYGLLQTSTVTIEVFFNEVSIKSFSKEIKYIGCGNSVFDDPELTKDYILIADFDIAVTTTKQFPLN